MFTTFLKKFREKILSSKRTRVCGKVSERLQKTYFLGGHLESKLDSAVLLDKIFKQEVFLKDHLHFLKIKENVDRSGRIAERKGNG